MRVGGDELDSGQAAGNEVTQERQPAGAVFTAGDLTRSTCRLVSAWA